MSERMGNYTCISCGNPLIEMEPDNYMCSRCNADITEQVRKAVTRRKEQKNSPKRIKVKLPPELVKSIIDRRAYGA